MNSRQRVVQERFLQDEKTVLKRLDKLYGQSLKDINQVIAQHYDSIKSLTEQLNELDPNDPMRAILQSRIRSKVYQKNYQEQLKNQVSGILNNLRTKQYTSISQYLDDCYTDGFIGAVYDLHGQDCPVITPINQQAVARAVQLESKISKGLYTKLGENVELLKRKITAQVSRALVTGQSFAQCAKAIADYTTIGYNRSVRIARTEGHRVQVSATMDAISDAKQRGADVVKQWDATLDGRTRESHRMVDGEIREIDQKFSNGLMYPGDPAGGAGEVVNCRCALLQRARWALDDAELKTLQERAKYFGLDKTQNFDDFKQKYLGATGTPTKLERIRPRRTSQTVDFETMGRAELIDFCNANLQTKVDFKGATDDAVKDMAKFLYDFEKMGGNLNGVQISFGTTKGLFGAFDPKTKRVTLQRNGNNVAQRRLAENERAMLKLGRVQHADPSYRGLIAHEVGHALDFLQGNEFSRIISNNKSLLIDAFSVSNYARTTPGLGAPRASEAFAECFSLYMKDKSKLPPSIREMLDKYFGTGTI